VSKLAPTDHLRPTASIAPQALLPGDPGRALALAQDLLEGPRMANHARGLWGYTAPTARGVQLTIQSTGIGGPSVAVVLEELARLGVRRAIRLGTCHAIDPGLPPGEMVVAAAAIPPGADGAPGGSRVEPDPGLTAALLAADDSLREVVVAGTDLYYDPEAARRTATRLAAGAEVVDLGTAAALAVGSRLGIAIASALVVAGSSGGERLDDEGIARASLRLGRAASAVVGG